jgi:hypothetical protein
MRASRSARNRCALAYSSKGTGDYSATSAREGSNLNLRATGLSRDQLLVEGILIARSAHGAQPRNMRGGGFGDGLRLRFRNVSWCSEVGRYLRAERMFLEIRTFVALAYFLHRI